MKESTLLTADAIINLLLGLPLVLFPTFVFQTLEIPTGENLLFPSILGGVLTGIGISLLMERYKSSLKVTGLGLGGAISINICGVGVLAVWLAKGSLNFPIHTYVIGWTIAVIILGISALELFDHFKRKNSG